jgi:ATP-binding cassette, subfamily B, bacterial
VRFAYAEGPTILDGVDLALEPGRTYAIVGPTGSGKSTLARLLARLWDPDAGRILLDGVDVRELARGVVPSQVAYVPQEPFLFDDTVRGNITLGDPRSTTRRTSRAVRLARLDEVVAGLPTGSRRVSASAARRCRAGSSSGSGSRVRSPAAALIVLDDATSAIDAEVEAEILAGLRDARLGATVVMVAARTSTISLADEVVHLVAGRVADRGTHPSSSSAPPPTPRSSRPTRATRHACRDLARRTRSRCSRRTRTRRRPRRDRLEPGGAAMSAADVGADRGRARGRRPTLAR